MLKLTRRQFGQLVIATATFAGLGYLGKRTVAQTSSIIYGVRVPKAGQLVIQSLDLATKQIQELTSVSIQSGEQLNSISYLGSNKFVLSISPLKSAAKGNNSPRLLTVTVGQSPTSTPISGLANDQNLANVLVTNDGSLVGLTHRSDKTSSTLVNIDANTGAINTINNITLPVSERFDNLAQSKLDNVAESNGIIYTTNLTQQGNTSLVQLDLTKGQVSPGAQLTIDGKVWNSGFSTLASASGDQIYALGAPRYVTPNNLYTINVSTGVMTLIQQWDVVKTTTSASGA
ncbi:MAG: hypothetical protein KME49_16255 [Brasilonema octagenarum HA4186-MV1]|jgi:hypothetical protein|uniref:DUF4394 domain-containing protein n=2 Tax=Brasilonema TaxID=383614 RepID=A0A856MHP6_9CYAN|nr:MULTISPECIES: hypothetical protein [Brasilonema]MBW4627008.1 hypothetical protein [Brasilonema octagenarum HA4186-MV1]NMF66969.1 hypothetical protein [Brasilonema octagenarum UFV-OR1]QDL10773.1 hypothetical protein DP114_25265 [Brasilonema sennae CENA114]QDL17118.1 hypothetical protein DP113_25170 [Brasilonema octagenarum UFV-E1]